MESMMTARQVAELLGVHENWVYDQAANGELPSYKIGGTRRFDPDELRGWIAAHREAEPKRLKRRAKPKRRRAKPTRRPNGRSLRCSSSDGARRVVPAAERERSATARAGSAPTAASARARSC